MLATEIPTSDVLGFSSSIFFLQALSLAVGLSSSSILSTFVKRLLYVFTREQKICDQLCLHDKLKSRGHVSRDLRVGHLF